MRCINSLVASATGKAPFEAVLGSIPRTKPEVASELLEPSEIYENPKEIHTEIRENIIAEQSKYKERYDKNKRINVKYNVGDIVFMKCNPVVTGSSTKLQNVFKGPLVVVRAYPSDTYLVKYLNEVGDRNYSTTAYVSQLKVWKGNDECEKYAKECKNCNDESESADESVVSRENQCLSKEIEDENKKVNEKVIATNNKDNTKKENRIELQPVELRKRIRKASARFNDFVAYK